MAAQEEEQRIQIKPLTYEEINRPQILEGQPAWEVATLEGEIARDSVFASYQHLADRLFDFGHLIELHRAYVALLGSLTRVRVKIDAGTGAMEVTADTAVREAMGIALKMAREAENQDKEALTMAQAEGLLSYHVPGAQPVAAMAAFAEQYVSLPRFPQARDYLRERLGVALPAGDVPLELHRMAHLAAANPGNDRIAAMAASGWAYVLAITYPKVGPVAGLGFRAAPTSKDFYKGRPYHGGEWVSLLALATRTQVPIRGTDADTLRILKQVLKAKNVRALVLEPEAKRYRYPTTLTPLQRTLTTKGAELEDYSHRGRVHRLTYSDKVSTQLSLEKHESSLEDVNAYVLRTVRELGPLTLKVWHAGLCFAAEDMNHGLSGEAFWWHPDRLLALEGMSFHSDNRRNREDKIRLLNEDLWHEVQIAAGMGQGITISGHLVTSIERDTTCTLTVNGRVLKWHRAVLHPTIAGEIIRAKNKGRFALLDKRWFRLDPAKYPIAVCLYPYLEDQWRRNAKDVAQGRRDRWLGLTLRSVAEAAGLDIDPINPSRTRERLRENLTHLEASGLIGGWEYSEDDNLLEDLIDARPPADHEGLNLLAAKYQNSLPAPKNDVSG